MADWTPSELDLLEYVEGDLEPTEAERVRAAVAASPELTQIVAELERGRDALRSGPALELPERRRQEIMASLPRQERDGWSFSALTSSPRRLLLVLTPVAAAAVAAIALTTLGGGSNDRERASVGAAAAPATTAAATQALDSAAAEAAKAPVVSVEGPAKEVAKLLRAQGLQAKATNGTVVVTGSDAATVKSALRGRPAGDVPVVLTP